MDQSNSESSLRLDIQGLRAVAVLAVIIYHVDNTLLPAGFLGVDVFFTISGFIISTLIIKAGADFNWINFYVGRVKRIVPAYGVLLLFVCFVSIVLFTQKDFEFFKYSLASSVFFISNNYFSYFGGYFSPSSYELPLLHTWSLAVEMQFYFILPLLLVFLPKSRLPVILGGIALLFFIYANYQAFFGSGAKYFSLFSRIPEFLLGSLFAIYFRQNSLSEKFSTLRSMLGIMFIIAGFFIVDEASFPNFWMLLPCVGVLLIIASPQSIINQKLLSNRAMVWVGGLSYSLYLWHWPFLAFFRYYFESYELNLFALASILILTFLMSFLSFKYIETPIRKTKKMSHVFAVVGGLFSLLVMLYILGPNANNKVAMPLTKHHLQYADGGEICHGKITNDCLQGDLNKKPTVLVIGDSHAAQLNYFFDEVGRQSNQSFKVVTASSCIPIAEFDIERLDPKLQRRCASQIEYIQSLLKEYDDIIIAGMWQWHAKSNKFLEAFSKFLDLQNSKQKRMFVFAQIPMFDSDVVKVSRFNELGLAGNIEKNKDWVKANLKIKEISDLYQTAYFLDFSMSDFFLNAPTYDGDLIYMDNHHLNEIGVRGYARSVSNQFLNELSKNNPNLY